MGNLLLEVLALVYFSLGILSVNVSLGFSMLGILLYHDLIIALEVHD